MATADFTRRDFVKGLSAATLGALAAGYPRQLLGEDPAEKLTPTADTVRAKSSDLKATWTKRGRL